MVAMMISTAPRALETGTIGERDQWSWPEKLAPRYAPATLPKVAMRITRAATNRDRARRWRDVYLQTGHGEEDRSKDREGHALQFVDDVGGKPGQTAEEDPDSKGPDHRLEPECLGEGAPGKGEHDHQCQDGVPTPESVPDQAQPSIDDKSADCHRRQDEDAHHRECQHNRTCGDGLCTGESRDQTQHRPACDVIDHSGGKDRLTKLPPHEVEVHQDLGQNWNRRDGQRGCEEEGEHGSIRRVDQQTVGQGKPRASPVTNGTTRPPTATPRATPKRRRIRARSVSSPVMTRRSMTPIRATTSSM